MRKVRNGIRHASSKNKEAQKLRRKGMTHREIAIQLNTSVSTAHAWTRGTRITKSQKQAIEKRRRKRRSMGDAEVIDVRLRLKKYQYKKRYSNKDLLKKIRQFFIRNGRIPLKREFNAWDIYRRRFGGWNAAIRKAGFEKNPELFAKKFIAKDGHRCDSFTEKVIDDWLFRVKETF